MALPAWLTISSASGNGNGTLTIKAGAYTGRVSRTYGDGTTSGIAVVAGSVRKYIAISQSAKAEYVKFSQALYETASDATTVTVTGTSNCAALTFMLSGSTTVTAASGQCQMTFRDGNTDKGTVYASETAKGIGFEKYSDTDTAGVRFTAAGSVQKSGVEMAGDPGATAEYDFSITLVFSGANTGSLAEAATLQAQGGTASVTDATTIKRKAADTFVNLGAASIELATEGTEETVDIDSNGTWAVSGA